MTVIPSSLRVAALLVAFLGLAACQSSEERAEAFYQSGLALMEEGDLDRAAIEFLNVFNHNGFHKDARRQLADLRVMQGDIPKAYGQYLRLIEQYPDTGDVRAILAELALQNGNWEEARRHGEAAIELVPDDPKAQSVARALAYRAAIEAEDEAAQAEAAAQAREVLEADETNDIARRVVVDHLLRSDTPFDAMAFIDEGLALDPESRDYNTLRLQLLVQVENIAAIGTQLQRMVEFYPEDEDLTRSLIGWYLSQGDLAGAENFLRQLAGAPTDAPEGHIAVVQLLEATQGAEAAKAELDRLAAANEGTENGDLYTTLSAVISFEAGEQDEAIATIEGVLDGAEPGEQTSRIRNILARLLIATDNQVGARAQVEQILSSDASNVDALLLRAGWAIDGDRPGDALVDLRTALGQDPRNAEILTLMAQAHERDGSTALAGERLSQAVSVSGSGLQESIRYAAFLEREGRLAAAETVLNDARTANPGQPELLARLANLMLQQGRWTQAQAIAEELRAIDTPEAQGAATSLQAALLLGQNQIEQSIDFLKDQVAGGDADTAAIAQILQIQVQAGELEAARAYLDEVLADRADDPALRMMDAGLAAVSGDLARSEEVYRALIEDFPQAENPVLQLYNLLRATDRADEATALVETAIEAQPGALNLLWIRASELEFAGDIEGSIAIYEDMYEVAPGSITIANNLASLIATHRDDPESLERAAAIARRLRDAEVPPFQDTYGWIAYRQGNYEEARTYLEPAAEGLPDDPLVQYHLGMTYAALEMPEEARAQLTRALDLAGDSDLPQFQTARETLEGLGE